MKKLYIVACVTLIAASCSVSKSIPLKFRIYDEPAINATQSRELGETLLTKGEEYYQTAVQITEMSETDFNISMVKYPYGVGDVLPLRGSNKDWNLYYKDIEKGTYALYYFGVAINKKNPNIKRPFLDSSNGFASKRMDAFSVKETTYTNQDCPKCFKKELVYNGKVGNNMKFIYREYIENLARPSFTQEMQYDLSESNIIGFKGARLEVEKATNTNITYKVLSSFQQ